MWQYWEHTAVYNAYIQLFLSVFILCKTMANKMCPPCLCARTREHCIYVLCMYIVCVCVCVCASQTYVCTQLCKYICISIISTTAQEVLSLIYNKSITVFQNSSTYFL